MSIPDIPSASRPPFKPSKNTEKTDRYLEKHPDVLKIATVQQLVPPIEHGEIPSHPITHTQTADFEKMGHAPEARNLKESFDFHNATLQRMIGSIESLPIDILRHHIFSKVGDFQTAQVSSTWRALSSEDAVWEKIVEKLGFPKLSAPQGKLHQVVRDFCKEYGKECARLPEATETIKALATGQMSIEKMLQLKEWRTARDTVVVWKTIAAQLNLPMPEIFSSDLNLIEQAKKFAEWLDDNEEQVMFLTELHLNDKQLASLPSEIEKLRSLNELHLQFNYLRSLPAEIGNFIVLEKLYLVGNLLTELPSSIGNLVLTHLDVTRNKLSSVPPSIGRLRYLTDLLLSDNELRSLPPEIGNLPSLRSLVVMNNKLSFLPPEIGNILSLQNLALKENELSALPPEIGGLTSLQNLNVAINKLPSLPPEIGRLTSLTTLNVSKNSLSSLPPEIGNLTALKNLIVPHNKLTTLPRELGKITDLKQIIANDNELTRISSKIFKLKKLYLTLENNPLTDSTKKHLRKVGYSY